jgi:hypothetical protein
MSRENMEPIITMKDIFGKTVSIRTSDLAERFMANMITLFGMDIPTIAELRLQYLLRGGSLNITKDTVREIFSKR